MSHDPTSLRQLEINNLKFELNPHTFKNVLQQIQSLSLSTNRAIENLMQILNYMLYETDKEQVPLQAEIDFMSSYRRMQQAIVPGFVDIIFDCTVSEPFLLQKGIAPLLTVAFLENAFKHADTSSKDCIINICVRDVDEDTLLYEIVNTKGPIQADKPRSGIGYKNLRRRLDLIYPDRYELETSEHGGQYRSTLRIKLHAYEN
jgi:two-component system LytT family sensor kinase